jgi:hypothetical protein
MKIKNLIIQFSLLFCILILSIHVNVSQTQSPEKSNVPNIKLSFVDKTFAQSAAYECTITIGTITIRDQNARTGDACRQAAQSALRAGQTGSFVFVDRTPSGINNAAINGTVSRPADTSPAPELEVSEANQGGGDIASSALTGCSTEIIKGTVVAGALTALGVTDRVVGVGVAESSNALGQIFTSSTAFLEFLNKNCLDPAAREVFKKLLAKSEQSILNWANNGFKGGPLDGGTFPTDLNEFMGLVRESSTDVWLADIDKSNPFGADIQNAVYLQERVRGGGYTPDLAETIFAAQCQEYERSINRQAVTGGEAGESTRSNFFGDVARDIRNIFRPAEEAPRPNNSGFRGQSSLEQYRLFSSLPTLQTEKAFAQSSSYECTITVRTAGIFPSTNIIRAQNITTSSACRDAAQAQVQGNETASYVFVDRTPSGINNAAVNGTVRANGNSTDTTALELSDANPGTNVVRENPCNRPMNTVADKQAVIDNYNSANRYPVSPMSEWEILAKSLQCKNMGSCAVQVALTERSSVVSNAQQTEQQTLANNNGNTGMRICTQYLPQSQEDRDANLPRVCRDMRTVTPGSIVASRVAASLETPTNNLVSLSSNATFKDLITSTITNLITGMTDQLINQTNGLLSFGGRNRSSQGSFTGGVRNLENTSTVSGSDTRSIATSLRNTETYIFTLTENKEILDSIISGVGEMSALCKEILDIKEARYIGSVRGISDENMNPANDRCNIDPAKQNYTNDPTAGARLANNPIYTEIRSLDATKSEREQLLISIANANKTQNDIESSQSESGATNSVERDIQLLRSLGNMAGRIPERDSIDAVSSNKQSLQSRLDTVQRIVNELKVTLAELK